MSSIIILIQSAVLLFSSLVDRSVHSDISRLFAPNKIKKINFSLKLISIYSILCDWRND